MNALETFLNSKPYGFLTSADMPELVKLDRLFQVLVRCGGCRFTCAAQDVAHLIKCIEAGGDYVRDVSLPVGWQSRAASWKPESQPAAAGSLNRPKSASIHPRRVCGPDFDESDCGGVFDGFGVVSDADSGL